MFPDLSMPYRTACVAWDAFAITIVRPLATCPTVTPVSVRA
jgi:hypothetical protein